MPFLFKQAIILVKKFVQLPFLHVHYLHALLYLLTVKQLSPILEFTKDQLRKFFLDQTSGMLQTETFLTLVFMCLRMTSAATPWDLTILFCHTEIRDRQPFYKQYVSKQEHMFTRWVVKELCSWGERHFLKITHTLLCIFFSFQCLCNSLGINITNCICSKFMVWKRLAYIEMQIYVFTSVFDYVYFMS